MKTTAPSEHVYGVWNWSISLPISSVELALPHSDFIGDVAIATGVVPVTLTLTVEDGNGNTNLRGRLRSIRGTF